jgi:hypothetical protein
MKEELGLQIDRNMEKAIDKFRKQTLEDLKKLLIKQKLWSKLLRR